MPFFPGFFFSPLVNGVDVLLFSEDNRLIPKFNKFSYQFDQMLYRIRLRLYRGFPDFYEKVL